MANILVERTFDPALGEPDFYALAAAAMGCLEIYRVTWHESFLAGDGRTLLCRFEAPDAEALRLVTRNDHAQSKQVLAGSVHGPDMTGPANVVVTRSFDAPASMDELQAREEAAAWCLQEHRVTFKRSFFSADRRRMCCFYQAPDAESVRVAQRRAQMPVESVLACRNYTPDNIFQ